MITVKIDESTVPYGYYTVIKEDGKKCAVTDLDSMAIVMDELKQDIRCGLRPDDDASLTSLTV